MAHRKTSRPLLGGSNAQRQKQQTTNGSSGSAGGGQQQQMFPFLVKVTAWFFSTALCVFVLCLIFSLVNLIVKLPETGRQAGEAFGEAFGRIAAPAPEQLLAKPKDDAAVRRRPGDVEVDNRDLLKSLRDGRPFRSEAGWKLAATEVSYEASGHAGIEGPLLNCDFMEGSTLAVHPGHRWPILLGFTSDDVFLVDSRARQLVSLNNEQVQPVAVEPSTGLVYLSTTAVMLSGGVKQPYGFTIRLVPPFSEEDKQPVREANWRDFRPQGGIADEAYWGPIPFRVDTDKPGRPVRVGFTIRIRLSRLPTDTPTVLDWRPDQTTLSAELVKASLLTAPEKELELLPETPIGVCTEITSAQLRDTWPEDDLHPQAWLFVRSMMPVRVDVAVLIHCGR